MVIEQNIIEDCHKHSYCIKRPCWTAVFVGALIGIGIAFLLNLFSVAIGLSILKTNAGVSTIAIGGLIGIAIATVVSTFVGGWTAGYLGRPHCEKRNLGVLYGFTSWCIALLLTILLVFPTIKYVAIYTRFISNPTATNWVPGMYRMHQSSTTQSPNTTSPDATTNQTAAPVPNIETLTAGAFVVFILFFLGALFSCFGGHCGMTHRCKERTVHDHP